MRDLTDEKDLLTVYLMIRINCCSKHHSKDILCDECQSLFDYARNKLQKCPFETNKPTCAQCRVHCYEPAMRKKIKEVMKFSGPRMIYRHPILAVRHLSQMLRSRKER